jgi:hypothetical protein
MNKESNNLKKIERKRQNKIYGLIKKEYKKAFTPLLDIFDFITEKDPSMYNISGVGSRNLIELHLDLEELCKGGYLKREEIEEGPISHYIYKVEGFFDTLKKIIK